MSDMLPPVVAMLAVQNAEANSAINETIVEVGKFGATVKEQAVGTQAAFDEITASMARMAEASGVSLGKIDEQTLVTAEDIKALALATEQASARMESAEAKAAAATDALGKTQTDSQAAFSQARTGVTVAAAAFDFLGVEAVKAAGNYQSSTQRIVSSGGEIQANIDKVRQGLLDMTTQVGYSADDLSAAFYKASSAGFNYAHGGLGVVQAAAEGAKTENADLALVSDALTSAMIDYHQPASQAAQVTSEMVAATSAGKLSFQDLAGALHSVLPNASAAHVSLQDILGDIAAITIHGESADQATQNLNDVISHMEKPTAAQAKELGLLHMTTNQLADDLKSKGLSGTLQEISNRINTFVQPGSGKVILDLKTALSGLSPAVQQLGAHLFDGTMSLKEYNKAAQALDPIDAKQAASFATLAGATHRIGDQMLSGAQVLQNYGGALAAATGDQTGMNVALMLSGENADTANTAIKQVGGAATEAGGHVQGWGGIQQTFNQKLADAKAGFGALVIEIGQQLLPVATKFLGFLTDGVKWLERHRTVAQVAGVAIGVLAGAFTLLTVAMWAASLTPVGIMIAGIMAAVIGLTILIYELVKHWNVVWGAIKKAAEVVWHALVDAWNATIHALSTAVEVVYRDVIRPIVRFFANDLVHPVMVTLRELERIWSVTWQAMKEVAGFFYGFFSVIVGDVVNVVKAILLPQIQLLETVWNAVWSALSTAAQWVWDNVLKPVFGAIYLVGIKPTIVAMTWLADQWGTIWGGIKIAFSAVWDALKVIFKAIFDYGIKPVWDGALEFYKVWQTTWNGIGDALKWVYDHTLKPIFDAVGGGLKDIGKMLSGGSSAGSTFAHMLGFADGGWVPGSPGEAQLAVVHGGEFVLSQDMIASMRNGGGGGPVPATASVPIGQGTPGQAVVVQANLYLDSKQVYTSLIPVAQQTKRRTGSTGLG